MLNLYCFECADYPVCLSTDKALHEKRNIRIAGRFCRYHVFALTLPATRHAIVYLDPVFVGLGRSVLVALVAGMLLLMFKAPVPTKSQFAQLMIVALGVVIGFPLYYFFGG